MRINGLELVRLIEQAQRLEEFEEAIARAVDPEPAHAGSIVNFFDVPTADLFDVPPEQAIGYFKAKGLRPTFSYADMMGEAHDHAFTVAKMMDVDLLGQVRASLDSAMANGTQFKEWADGLVPILQSAGWWGRKEMLDPLTGKVMIAQLGSPWRLETIFRTNMQTSYAVGQWQEIAEQSDIAPFLMYDAIDDFRTRPLHASWDRKVLPVSSAWWKTHYPPNGWNCRCGVIQLDATEVKRLGLAQSEPPNDGFYTWQNPRTGEISKIPNGIDPSFNKNSGMNYLADLKTLQAEKVAALPPGMRAAAAAAKAQTDKMLADLTAATAQSAEEIAKAEAAALANLRRMQAKVSAQAKEAEAQLQIDAIAKGKEAVGGTGAQYKVKALAQLKKSDTWPEMKPSEQLAAIDDLAAQLKKQNETASKVALYKKSILEGKTPPPGAVKAFQSLGAADQAAILDKLDKDLAAIKAAKAAEEAAKLQAAAPAPSAPPPKIVTGTPPNPNSLTQIGPQKGSNPGGTYRDTETGATWYIKQPSNPDMARNEVLAAKLYELAGVDVPELHIIQMNGVESIASRIVDGLAKGTPADLALAAGTADGFVVDAWLANWDVVGLGYDNLLLKGARAMRVDTGGALRYRAQGGLKGKAFSDDVPELQSLRDPSLNRQAHSVFGNLTDAQIEAGAVRVISITDEQITQIVDAYGPKDSAEAAELTGRLIARREAIAAKFPEAARKARAHNTAAEAPPPAAARVTAAEQAAVEDSRVNGYGFATDSDQIEDNMVVVHAFKDAKGADTTRGFFKLRPDASKELAKLASQGEGGGGLAVELDVVKTDILGAIKSINMRAAKGAPLAAADVQKIAERIATLESSLKDTLLVMDDAIAKAVDPSELVTQRQIVKAWADRVLEYKTTAVEGATIDKIAGLFPFDSIPSRMAYAEKTAKAVAAPAVQWKRVSGSYEFNTSKFDRSFATETSAKAHVTGVSLRYEATLADGTRVTYFPHDSSVAYAMQGVVKIDTPGRSATSTGRIFGAIEEVGLKSHRATELDRKHLYLNGFARIRLLRGKELAARAQFDAITDKGEEGIRQKLQILKNATGVDVEKSRGWTTIDGVRQAFGHGKAHQLRPDLEGPEFEAFNRDYVLFHNPQGLGTNAGSNAFDSLKPVIEGGGQMASLTDRVRRGVPLSGSSVSSDLASGGGDYLFTRIKKRGTTGTGVYWKASQVKRMDAITYNSDQFGRTTAGHVEQNRMGQTVASLKDVANSNGNETIFKGGLSLFDDIDRIVLQDTKEVISAIKWMQDKGYKRWPDGRELSEVIITKARNDANP